MSQEPSTLLRSQPCNGLQHRAGTLLWAHCRVHPKVMSVVSSHVSCHPPLHRHRVVVRQLRVCLQVTAVFVAHALDMPMFMLTDAQQMALALCRPHRVHGNDGEPLRLESCSIHQRLCSTSLARVLVGVLMANTCNWGFLGDTTRGQHTLQKNKRR